MADYVDPIVVMLQLLATADEIQRQDRGMAGLQKARAVYRQAFDVLEGGIPAAAAAAAAASASSSPLFEAGAPRPLVEGIIIAAYTSLSNRVDGESAQRGLLAGLISSAECCSRIVSRCIGEFNRDPALLVDAQGLSMHANQCLLLACQLADAAYAEAISVSEADDVADVQPSQALQVIYAMIGMIQDWRGRDLDELRRIHDRILGRLQPLDDSAQTARERMGEERWNANKPKDQRCDFAQQRAQLREDIRSVEALQEEIKQAQANLHARQPNAPPPNHPPAGPAGGDGGAGVGAGPNFGGQRRRGDGGNGRGGNRGGRGRSRGAAAAAGGLGGGAAAAGNVAGAAPAAAPVGAGGVGGGNRGRGGRVDGGQQQQRPARRVNPLGPVAPPQPQVGQAGPAPQR